MGSRAEAWHRHRKDKANPLPLDSLSESNRTVTWLLGGQRTGTVTWPLGGLREKVRPTIWQTLAPLAPVITAERTETAQEPRTTKTEVRGVGSRKRDGSTGRTSGLDEKRVRFQPSARIIPDAWFAVLAEGVRFPSREAEERLKSQLLGRTIRDVAFGEGGREANDETKPEASGETGCESESDGEQKEERAVEDTPTAEVTCEPVTRGDEEREGEVQGSTDLDESVSYVCRIEGKFADLKERMVKLRLNRIRFAQRIKEFGYDKAGWKERSKEREKASVKGKAEEPQAAAIEEWDNRLYLNVRIEGTEYRALYDTGAT